MTEPDDWHDVRAGLLTELEPPPLSEITRRAAGRRRQRVRRIAGLAVVAAVVVAIPLTASLVPRAGSQLPAGGATPASTTLISVPSSTPTPAGSAGTVEIIPFTYWGADFIDAEHGYVLAGRCADRASCGLTLTEIRPGPAPAAVRKVPLPYSVDQSYELTVLGTGRALVRSTDAHGTISALVTADSGVTWRAAPTTPQGHITKLPDGAALENPCATGWGRCAGGPTVRLPDGALTTLSTVPNVDVRSLSRHADGTWWLWATAVASEGAPVLYRSTDAGTTWTASRLATVGQPIFAIHAAAVGSAGSVWYAAVIGQLPEVKNGLLAMDRSTDGGRTWTRVWQDHGNAEPLSSSGSPVIRADGTIGVLTDLSRCFVSRDGGRSFNADPTCDAEAWTSYSHGLYIRTNGGTSVLTSEDGVVWRQFRL